jgi:hypothetical protein
MRLAPSALVLALPLGVACAGAVPGADCTHAAAVQEIVWEQDCSGCAEGLRLRFGRDGRALLTVTGKARFRTTDREQPAVLAAADFDRLVRALADAGFFTLAPLHEDPTLADGRWTQWRAGCTRGSREVWRRDTAGPPALDALDAVLQAWRLRLWPAS